MRRVLLWLFVTLMALSGCGGGAGSVGGGDGSDSDDPPDSIPLPQGATLSMINSEAVVLAQAPEGMASALAPATLSVEFLDSDNVARVTLNGSSDLLSYDGFTQYEDNARRKSLFFSHGFVDGAFDEEAVAMIFHDGTSAFPRVFGVLSDTADLPTSGVVEYTGRGELWTGAIGATSPQVTLEVDFNTARVDGEVALAIYSAPNVGLSFEDAQIVDGQFSGTLTSDLVTLDHGEINGGFYGTDGSRVAGTVLVVSPVGVSNGYYIADRVE